MRFGLLVFVSAGCVTANQYFLKSTALAGVPARADSFRRGKIVFSATLCAVGAPRRSGRGRELAGPRQPLRGARPGRRAFLTQKGPKKLRFFGAFLSQKGSPLWGRAQKWVILAILGVFGGFWRRISLATAAGGYAKPADSRKWLRGKNRRFGGIDPWGYRAVFA